MTWENMSRMLQATDQLTPTQQIASDFTGFGDIHDLRVILLWFQILDKDTLEANNLGLAKAKKWMAKIFDVFDDEIDGLMYAHDDLGEAIYHLDSSAEKQRNFSGSICSSSFEHELWKD